MLYFGGVCARARAGGGLLRFAVVCFFMVVLLMLVNVVVFMGFITQFVVFCLFDAIVE